MDLIWVGMTQVWSEDVRTSRWTSRWLSSRTTRGTSGSTSGNLRLSDECGSMSQELSRVVSVKVKGGYKKHFSQSSAQSSKLKSPFE